MATRFGRKVLLFFVVILLGASANQLFPGVRLVIVRDRNLYTVDEFGGHYRLLTDSAQEPKWEPRFSPDGKLVAYFADVSGNKELRLLDYNTTTVRTLATQGTIGWIPYGDGGPAWSSDGARIYFGISRHPGDCEIGRIGLDGSGFINFSDYAGYNTQSFDISPVSALSTFVRGVEGNGYTNRLYIADLSINNEMLIQGDYAPHRPRISPDGLRIAYTEGNMGTRIVNIDGTGDREILGSAYPVCWHPDGKRLLVSEGNALYWIEPDKQDINMTFLAYGWWATVSKIELFRASAGDNIVISSDAKPSTVLLGNIILSPGFESIFNYRWREGENPLSDWAAADSELKCPLDLASIPLLVGTHTLTLEVEDGGEISSDEMILTIENSAPHAAASGGGVLELPAFATLGGFVSDFDGDLLLYRWLEDGLLLFEGSIQAITAGQPVKLPDFLCPVYVLGEHTYRLEVSDSVNPPASSDVKIRAIDTTAPSISPIVSNTILWPPNHQFVDILVATNVTDNSGASRISVSISSNEPENGTGDGDMSPDWTLPIIDQQTGIIRFQLRSERAGSGSGRRYTVLISASDSSGNTSNTSIEIIVPHDKKR